MKVLRKNFNYINVSLFILISILYLYSLMALSKGQSALDILTKPILDPISMLIVVIGGIVLFNVRLFNKISEKWLLFFICVSIFRGFLLLTSNFNKIILILNFVYIFFAFYFYIAWEVELKRSCYNPNFQKNDLNKHQRFPLEGMLKIDGQNFACHVSNIDETSLFVIFKDGPPREIKNLLANSEAEVSVQIDHIFFTQQVSVIGQYDLGLGLSYLKNKKDPNSTKTYDFAQLYEILIDRGLFI